MRHSFNHDLFLKTGSLKWQEIKGLDKFESFTVIDVKEPNLGHAVNENEIRKFVGLKKYHCMFAEKDLDNEVMFRLATCVCDICLSGQYRNCNESAIFGPWVSHNIQKTDGNTLIIDDSDENDGDDIDGDDDELEDLGSEGEQFEEDEVMQDVADIIEISFEKMQLEIGNYFIIEISGKQYVAKMVDNFTTNIVCFKFLRRVFYSSLNNFLKFDFPAVEDYIEFDLQSETFIIKAWVKDYDFGRRGALLLNSIIKRVFTNLN